MKILKQTISATLSLGLLLNAFTPLSAQNINSLPGFGQQNMQKEAAKIDNFLNIKPANSADFLNPYRGLKYFQALNVFNKSNPKGEIGVFHQTFFIDPAWRAYSTAIKNYTASEFANLTPYEMIDVMSQQTNSIAKLLKNNPRYKKEVTKLKVKEYTGACLQGIVLGAILVLCAPVALASGGLVAGSWFGATAVGTLALTSVSLTKTLFIVGLLEIVTILGSEIANNLYEDLTNRLIKYNYIDNGTHAKGLVDNAAKGSIANASMVETPASCENPEQPEVTRSTRWVDGIAKEEAIIRLHGLIVIKNELQYSVDPAKYDMALLDIINLFSERTQVQYDEKVFTRTIIEHGEKRFEKNTDIVDVGTGRLLNRTPELTKALRAIQVM